MTEETGEIRLVRIETKLDILITQQEQRNIDYERRLRALERARWPLPSLAILLSVASLLAMLYSLLGRH